MLRVGVYGGLRPVALKGCNSGERKYAQGAQELLVVRSTSVRIRAGVGVRISVGVYTRCDRLLFSETPLPSSLEESYNCS